MMARLLAIACFLLCTAQTIAAPDGQALYTAHCNACHQSEGRGGIGSPLSAAKLRLVSDEYLRKTVRFGRPGRVMPAFPTLSDAQVDALVDYVRTLTDTPHREVDATPVAGNVDAGATLYRQICAACHGRDGSGEGMGTGVTMSRKRSFLVMPPAIGNHAFLAAASDQQIKRVVMQGIAGTAMPAFEGKLSESEIDDIIAHLRAMGAASAAASVGSEEEPDSPSIVLESPHDFESTVEAVQAALVGQNFRTFPKRYLEQGLTDEFSVNQRQVAIRFCNFKKLYALIRSEPRIGVMLPCRITILEREDGSVLLVVPNLALAASWFNNDDLIHLWRGMEDTFSAVLEEVML